MKEETDGKVEARKSFVKLFHDRGKINGVPIIDSLQPFVHDTKRAGKV